MKPPAVCCDLAAVAAVRVSLERLPELRRQPVPAWAEPLPASFLKHADEQTVAGLVAVYRAIEQGELQTTCFRDWGVVASPRFLGRPAMAAALRRFQEEGAWGVSPHLIPHRSLHSISGTISQALQIHGPNFGVGGGPGGATEAVLAAAAMLAGQRLPGVWLVLTGLDPESAPDDSGQPARGTECVGLALALTPIRAGHSRMRLCIEGAARVSERRDEDASFGFDFLQLEKLLSAACGNATVFHALDAGLGMELSRPTVEAIGSLR